MEENNLNLKKNVNSKAVFTKIAIVIVIIAAAIILKDELVYQFGGYDEYGYEDEYVSEELSFADYDCNVAGVMLHGDLFTYMLPNDDEEVAYDMSSSEDIDYAIQNAEASDNIKAIILEIDSYGGAPVAAEEVADAVLNANKPTVALIREIGISAAYWAATGADIIFASANSDVGGIGVTMSYLDNIFKNQKEGLTFNQISSGKYKDMGNPNKVLTYEEKQLLQRDINIYHDNFVNDVAENREMDIEQVKKLADGASMPGQLALDNGLIDRIGGIYEVEEYLEELLGEGIAICW